MNDQRTSRLKSALQFLIGIGVIALIGILAFTLWPRPDVPPGWMIIRPPQDVMVVVEFEDAIWAGGRDGLVVIDRETGELVREVKLDGGTDFVTALVLDPDGDSLWVGHLNGVTRISENSWKTYTSADGLFDDQIFSLGFDSESALWVGTAKGVMWFDGSGFHPARWLRKHGEPHGYPGGKRAGGARVLLHIYMHSLHAATLRNRS